MTNICGWLMGFIVLIAIRSNRSSKKRTSFVTKIKLHFVLPNLDLGLRKADQLQIFVKIDCI